MIYLVEELKDLQLPLKLLFTLVMPCDPDNLNCHMLLLLQIKCFQDYPKYSRAQFLYDAITLFQDDAWLKHGSDLSLVDKSIL